MQDETLVIKVKSHSYLIRHLFRFSLALSLLIHFLFFGGYFVSKYWPGNALQLDKGVELDPSEIELDVPQELIGGTSSPAPVEKQEWIEGTKKTGEDQADEEINTNQISGDGKDQNGYLFSFNGDLPPKWTIDFDQNQYFPAAAKAAGVKEYLVKVLIQVDENGNLVSARVMSGKAPYGFNDAALKIVNRAKWAAGIKSGQKVKMAHYLDVNFTLPE